MIEIIAALTYTAPPSAPPPRAKLLKKVDPLMMTFIESMYTAPPCAPPPTAVLLLNVHTVIFASVTADTYSAPPSKSAELVVNVQLSIVRVSDPIMDQAPPLNIILLECGSMMKFESLSMKLSTNLAVLLPQLTNERPLIASVSTKLIVILLEPVHVILQLEEELSYTDIEKQLLAVIEYSVPST